MTYEFWFLWDRDWNWFLPLGFSELNNEYAKEKYLWVLDLWIISIRKWKTDLV